MTLTDTLVRKGIDTARPVLERFGIMASPLTEAIDARRSVTVGRDMEAVRRVLVELERAGTLFGAGAAPEDATPGGSGAVGWGLGDGGRASATLRPGPGGTTELSVEVHLQKPTDGAHLRYAHNAGVIALRAAHRAKSLVETGEVATLAHNPTTRSAPDPYGD